MDKHYLLQKQSPGRTSTAWTDDSKYAYSPKGLEAVQREFEAKVAWRHTNEQSRATHWRIVERHECVLGEI